MAVPDIRTDQIRTITDHMKKDFKKWKAEIEFSSNNKTKSF